MLAKHYNFIKYGKMPKAESIDMEATGRKLKRMIKKSGYRQGHADRTSATPFGT